MYSYDVVVVGSGAAAMAAAVTAAKSGLQVLVVEKGAVFGGTGAMSGGVVWIPNNPMLDKISQTTGEYDSRERSLRYFESVVGPERMRSAMMNAFYDNGREMIEFLARETEVQFESAPYPDYKSHLPGGMPVGRSISAKAFDGRRLGKWLARLKRPMAETCIFDSMMIDVADARQLAQLTRSPRAMLYMCGRTLGYWRDLMLHGRGVWLTMGNALIARLMRSALDAGADLWWSTSGKRLVISEGRVSGIVIEREGREIEIGVQRGVVLGAGGFPHDEELKRKLIPFPDQHETLTPETNSGDGIRMGLAVGGQIGGNTWHNFLGTQVAIMRDQAGRVVSKIPFMRLDRNKPGYLLVNKQGRRFVNEAWPYNDVAHAMNETEGAVPSYLICDHVRLRRYGLGLVRPGPGLARPLGRYLKSGHLFQGRTLDELADRMGIDPTGLKVSVARMNAYACTGIDLEFHKGETVYDRWQGDPQVKPNPSLGPVEIGPYYGIMLWPGNLGTFCGLVTDEHARVLDAQDQPIAGLYAVGGDMHPMLTGSYPGGGGSIGPGMTFGYIAGKTLAD